jgi:Predicted membrane protein
MLVVLCIDLDDDLGRKTSIETPVVGRQQVEAAAVTLATADPEDSDVNVLFQGLAEYDRLQRDTAVTDSVAVAAITGTAGRDVAANRAIGAELDEVLARLAPTTTSQAILITDGAQDESMVPIVRSRMPIDGVRRVVVRQAEDLESIYYTIKQVIGDPETRGTVLVPLGMLLLLYPLLTIATLFDIRGSVVLGVISAVIGLYTLSRGLGLQERLVTLAQRSRGVLYEGRITLLTYVAAAALVLVGGVRGTGLVTTTMELLEAPSIAVLTAAFAHGAIRWLVAAAVVISVGRITDEYLRGRFRWRILNAPVYVVAIGVVLYVISGFVMPGVIPDVGRFTLVEVALGLAGGTLLGVISTLALSIAEARAGVVGDAARS